MNTVLSLLLLLTPIAQKYKAGGALSTRIVPENCGPTASTPITLSNFNMTFFETTTNSTVNVYGSLVLNGTCTSSPSSNVMKNPITAHIVTSVDLNPSWLAAKPSAICQNEKMYNICLLYSTSTQGRRLAWGTLNGTAGIYVYQVTSYNGHAFDVFVGSSTNIVDIPSVITTTGTVLYTTSTGTIVNYNVNGTLSTTNTSTTKTQTYKIASPTVTAKSGAKGLAVGSLFIGALALVIF
jgi:hypothetical protein